MIIVCKSGQTSGTKLPRSSQSCAVLIWDPATGLSLLSAGLSEHFPAQQLLLGWEKSQLSQSGIPNGTRGLCPTLLNKAFLFPVLFTALSKRYCKVCFTLKVQKDLQPAAGNQKSPGLLTPSDMLSKQVFCWCLFFSSLYI